MQIVQEHYKGIDGTENVAKAPEMMLYVRDIVSKGISSVLEGIYGDAEQVAKISGVAQTNIDGKKQEIKQLVGTIIPIVKVSDKGNVIITNSKSVIDALGMQILKIINEGGSSDEIRGHYEAFKILNEQSATGEYELEFTPHNEGGKFEDFAEIVPVRV